MAAAPISVTLSAGPGPHRVGEPVAIAVAVRNTSAAALWFVGVLDGSEDGTRYPRYLPRVTRGGALVAAPGQPEDPLVSPLRLVDFRRLEPGAAFDPTRAEGGAAYLPLSTFATFRPAAPGRHELSLEVSTESADPSQWLGRFGQEPERAAVLERVAEVPRLTARSNVLEIEVTAS